MVFGGQRGVGRVLGAGAQPVEGAGLAGVGGEAAAEDRHRGGGQLPGELRDQSREPLLLGVFGALGVGENLEVVRLGARDTDQFLGGLAVAGLVEFGDHCGLDQVEVEAFGGVEGQLTLPGLQHLLDVGGAVECSYLPGVVGVAGREHVRKGVRLAGLTLVDYIERKYPETGSNPVLLDIASRMRGE